MRRQRGRFDRGRRDGGGAGERDGPDGELGRERDGADDGGHDADDGDGVGLGRTDAEQRRGDDESDDRDERDGDDGDDGGGERVEHG